MKIGASFVLGMMTGIGVGKFLLPEKKVEEIKLPRDIQDQLKRITLIDRDANKSPTDMKVLGFWRDGPWDVWLIGYSFDGPPNDVLIDLGYNYETGELWATISKLAWHRVAVLLDGDEIVELGAIWQDRQAAIGQVAIKLSGRKYRI